MNSKARHSVLSIALFALAILTGCAGMNDRKPAADYAVIVAAPDRSEADRKTDQRRDPVKLFAFTGVGPGMKVLEMGAGGGYTAELLARGVGPTGTVYAQNQPPVMERAAEAYANRAKAPAMKNVVYVLRPFEESSAARRRRSRRDHVFLRVSRHGSHGRRSREDEPPALRRAQAGRGAHRRRPLGARRRRHPASPRACTGSRSRRSRRRSRLRGSSSLRPAIFCAIPRTSATSWSSARRRPSTIRAEVPEARDDRAAGRPRGSSDRLAALAQADSRQKAPHPRPTVSHSTVLIPPVPPRTIGSRGRRAPGERAERAVLLRANLLGDLPEQLCFDRRRGRRSAARVRIAWELVAGFRPVCPSEGLLRLGVSDPAVCPVARRAPRR